MPSRASESLAILGECNPEIPGRKGKNLPLGMGERRGQKQRDERQYSTCAHWNLLQARPKSYAGKIRSSAFQLRTMHFSYFALQSPRKSKEPTIGLLG